MEAICCGNVAEGRLNGGVWGTLESVILVGGCVNREAVLSEGETSWLSAI